MASGGTNSLEPLLDWLIQLDVITKRDSRRYIQSPPQEFFDELRNGIILGKLAVAAVSKDSGNYNPQRWSTLSTTAITRYVRLAVATNKITLLSHLTLRFPNCFFKYFQRGKENKH